ncbi:hypothetical protein LWI29_033782 [Acer saccharum]|uniref:Uncharacterized protein n=1 Tax=Acer saccharum TaxID=4024 RepID=A0AA39TG66_ACESA|nr:hypothetical protein LWI29_033782 [Acer saccharum]
MVMLVFPVNYYKEVLGEVLFTYLVPGKQSIGFLCENSMSIQSNALCRLCPSIDVKAEVTRRSCGYTNGALSAPLYLLLMKEQGMTLSILAAVSGIMFLPEIFLKKDLLYNLGSKNHNKNTLNSPHTLSLAPLPVLSLRIMIMRIMRMLKLHLHGVDICNDLVDLGTWVESVKISMIS